MIIHFPFQMQIQYFLNEILNTNFTPSKPMQVLMSMHMQNENEYAPMQIFLYFQSKWMKMQKGTIKFTVPSARSNSQAKKDTETQGLMH